MRFNVYQQHYQQQKYEDHDVASVILPYQCNAICWKTTEREECGAMTVMMTWTMTYGKQITNGIGDSRRIIACQ